MHGAFARCRVPRPVRTLTVTADSLRRDKEGDMPKYVIERDLTGAGSLTGDELTGISQKSNDVLDGMGGRAQWLESFVTADKIFCIYIADSPETVREHGSKGGFPVTAVHRVSSVIDPTTAERELTTAS